MAEISEYERIRLKNIEENRRMLLQLGLLSEDKKPPVPKLQKPVFTKRLVLKKKKKAENGDPTYFPGRRSLRGSYSNDADDSDYTDSINGEYSGSENGNVSGIGKEKEKLPKRPNVYGAIEGIEMGDIWETRIECSRAGVHRPTVAGIHPGPEGAYSIALSGGYEDNYDAGESFTYTGAGGRDLKGTKACPKNLRTGPQVRDQTLDGANGSLATSVETRKPVRVIRGYKSSSIYAPEFGYRYDGLYQVENYWTAKGQSGHLVYKFALKRCPDQDPPPWTFENDISLDEEKQDDLSADEVHDKTMNPFVQMGKKVNVKGLLNSSETEGDLSDNFVNRIVVNSPKKTSKKNDNVSGSDSLELNGNEKTSHELKSEKSPETKTVVSSTPKKSPKKINSQNSPQVKEVGCKSPVKMIASNQCIDEFSLLQCDNGKISSDDKELQQLNNSRRNSPVKNEPGSGSEPINNKDHTPKKLVLNDTSPDIFESSPTGYLKSRRNQENLFGKNKGKKRSPSPDDFAKICDELCNELPKIEKVKRLRFSFENFSDNDLELNAVKMRRKRTSRAPRKSSLLLNRNPSDANKDEERNNCDMIFRKYFEILLRKFSDADVDFFGWDDYSVDFEGWTDKDVVEAKRYTSSFSDFVFKYNENNSFSSDESGWAGWEDVSRRSLVLNGFLLDEISRNRKSCDSDVTDVAEEFHGQLTEKSVN